MSWWWECGVVSMSDVKVVKSVTGLCPMYAHRMGHLPPFDFRRCWRRSLKVLLWRLILSLAVNLQPPANVRVCEWGLALCVYEGWAVFSFASEAMYSPRQLQRVPPSPVG